MSATRMRTFLAVVDTGSVHAAAASLHVSEPAVSTAIGKLARQLGTQLFRRDGRGLRLTASGEMYAGYSRTILGLMEQASAAVRSAEEGRLRIGAVATASEVVLPPALAAFHEQYSQVRLSLVVAARDQLFDQLQHHEVDLVVGGRPPHGSGLVQRARRANQLIVVGAPRLVGDGELDLARATWLMRGAGSGLRETTARLLAQLDLDPPALTLGSHGAVIASARAALGITLAHADAVAEDLERGTLRQLDVPRTPMDRPWVLTTAGRETPTARLFTDHLTDVTQMGPGVFDSVG